MINDKLNILVTNDDGYNAKGIKVLARMMSKYGNVTVIGPKYHQSGMGMAVSIGIKKLAYKDLGEHDGCHWAYLDSTPASCVKYGINFCDPLPDVVISGINHGSNASTAACYSGTLGAVMEAALNGIPGIGVSIDTIHPDADFSNVEKYFPAIFEDLMARSRKAPFGVYYNVNFPNINEIKGIRTGHMGLGRWVKEFTDWNPDIYRRLGMTMEMFSSQMNKEEPGEKFYMMIGTFIDSDANTPGADHHLVRDGYISVTAHNIVTSDPTETAALKSDSNLNKDFR
ncbi:MAG: 5'/3'-nucleotidase SurE [Bacteroidales bacterium]|nr:5'/3'-nucleotidase SurE [Bacteroidales bacterium]